MGPIDKDVVAFNVTMNDGGIVRMQVGESFENLPRPPLDDFKIRDLQLFDVSFRRKERVPLLDSL